MVNIFRCSKAINGSVVWGSYGYCDLVDAGAVHVRYFDTEAMPGYDIAFFGHLSHSFGY